MSGSKKKASKEVEYDVKNVLNKRLGPDGINYLLSWKHYHIRECTWEPLSNIEAKDLVRSYETRAQEENDRSTYVTANDRCVKTIMGLVRRDEQVYFLVQFIDDAVYAIPGTFVAARMPRKLKEFMKKNDALLPVHPTSARIA